MTRGLFNQQFTGGVLLALDLLASTVLGSTGVTRIEAEFGHAFVLEKHNSFDAAVQSKAPALRPGESGMFLCFCSFPRPHLH